MKPYSPRLLVLVGPTAIGKTALSIRIAKAFRGEIVSADSRTLYRGMDIGTDKPAEADRETIPHHLIDICRPDETLTLGQYQRLAYKIIAETNKRGRLPILVGGTGQYVKAVVEGWGIPAVAPRIRMRQALEALGGEELFRWLKHLDPVAAERIDHRNVRRIIRALEVTMTLGKPISLMQRKQKPEFQFKVVGLTVERELLYQRIDERVDSMIEDGLLREVEQLRKAGFKRQLPSMSGLGYRQLNAYLEGECTLQEAIERIKFETHRFVRQQYTWFRLADPTINWYSIQDDEWESRLFDDVKAWLAAIS